MTIIPFLHLPEPATFSSFHTVTAYVRRLREAIIQAKRGKLECVGEFTLTANAATTVLNYKGLSPQSVLILDPKTANAATEKAAGTIYVLTANRGNDAWTITHANNAQADRTFQFAVIG